MMSTILWICGRPGSGKSTLLNALCEAVDDSFGYDAEGVRNALYPTMPYTDEAREWNIRILAELACTAAVAWKCVAVAAVTPTEHLRDIARARCDQHEFVLVHMEGRSRPLWPGTTYEEPRIPDHVIKNIEGTDLAAVAKELLK